MKSFKHFRETVERRRSEDENAFIDKHQVDKKEHPVAKDDQFVAKTKKDTKNAASYKEGEDSKVYEETEQEDEEPLSEEEKMSKAQMKKREEIVKSMKKDKAGFKDRYGDKADDVMYATATKMAMKSEETELEEGVIDDLRNIVKRKSAMPVKFANGQKTKVDMFTASAMVKVHDALNDANKKKFADAINKDERMFMKMMDFAMSKAK